jgi:predicted enzyme related to lactoylglutathione lyase
MFKDTPVVNGFSTNDIVKAKEFYGTTLGFTMEESGGGILALQFANGGRTFVYPKPNHEPATFTIMNIMVDDIEKAVDDLTAQGVEFEHYDGEMQTDEKGIAWGEKVNMGPNIAWFKDPAGNILSVLES